MSDITEEQINDIITGNWTPEQVATFERAHEGLGRGMITEAAYQELQSHAIDLEEAAIGLRVTAKKAKYSHERRSAAAAASAYEISAVWIRGFLRRVKVITK